MNIPRQRRYPIRPTRGRWNQDGEQATLTPTRPARPPVGAHVITTDDGPQEWEYQRDGRWIHFRHVCGYPTYITSTTSLNVARPE